MAVATGRSVHPAVSPFHLEHLHSMNSVAGIPHAPARSKLTSRSDGVVAGGC